MKHVDLLDRLRKLNLVQEQAIELYYLLKAWKILSIEDIEDEQLRYNTFFNKKVESKKMLKSFEELAKKHKVFQYYLEQNSNILKIDSDILALLYNIVEDEDISLSINDAFFSQKNYRDFSLSYELADLSVKLITTDDKKLYVPFTNGFTHSYVTDIQVCMESDNIHNAFIAELIKIIENKDLDFRLSDPLSNPSFINLNAPHLLEQFEAVISFPPFGRRVKKDFSADKFNRFKFHRGINLEIAYFEHILSQCSKKAAVLMPVGFSFRGGNEERFRKYLIEKNLIEAVIQLPSNMYNATSIESTLFIINKQKENENVLFISLKDKQFVDKKSRKIILANIDRVVDIYKEKQEIENISILVKNEQIATTNYSLGVDRYVISAEAKKLQEILSNYRTIPLENIAEVRRSQLFKNEEEGKEVYELSPSDFAKAGFTMEGGKLKKIGEQYTRYLTYKLQAFDVLVSTKGTIGKVAIIGEISEPIVASQASQVIRLDDKNKAIELYMFLKSNLGQALLKQLTVGSSMPQISTNDIKKMPIPQLSQDEQKKVLLNFKSEIKLYNEIKKLQETIKQIHSNFLGENK